MIVAPINLLRPKREQKESPNSGKGLKIPFDLLVQISAVEFPINIRGKMALAGYQTALFPVHMDTEYVQFHLEVSQEEQINPYHLEQSKESISWDDNLIGKFRERDCYVGWCKSARIHLGTTSLINPCGLRFTDVPEKSQSLRLEGVSAGFLAASTAPLQVGGSLQANFRFQANRLNFAPSTVFTQILRNTSRELALIYDATTERAWVVPKLSLLLYMCQVWYIDNGSPSDCTVPAVEPYSDVEEVIQALEDKGDNRLCGRDDHALSLRTLLVGFNINLLQCIQVTEEARRQTLYGFDIMDVVTEPGRGSCLRRARLGSSVKTWLPLASSVDSIVICAGIGDVICKHPSDGDEQCSTLPEGRDCLGIPMSCLRTLIRRNGKVMPDILHRRESTFDFSNKACLSLGSTCFEDCNHQDGGRGECGCWTGSGKLQRLVSKPRWEAIMARKLLSPVDKGVDCFDIPMSGAIAFG